VNCRATADAADTCVTDIVTVTNHSATPFNNFCTNSDGPMDQTCEGATTRMLNDLWYKFVAPETGEAVIETCDTTSEFDTVMAVYTTGTATCPCPTDTGDQLDCNDDGCVFSGAGSSLTLNVTTGVCYTIRVGGFNGEKGRGVLHIDVGGGTVLPNAVNPDPGVNKTRFISFTNPNAVETAIRVKLTSLHHVVPPYTGGASVPFTAFEGQYRWVGPPAQYIESTAQPIPFYASFLQCTPHYRNWSTVGLLHVSGTEVVPSSLYDVQTFAASCQGNEAACTAISAVVQFATTRWGDVEAPYQPPDPTQQPNVADISALVNKFKSALGAPIKVRALLTPSLLTSQMGVDVAFNQISACVDAFKGTPYPFSPTACP
jgi:hypothetical protein